MSCICAHACLDTGHLLILPIPCPLYVYTQTAIENRNSVLHGAAVISHGYMNAGTTTDTFLRENLEWLGRASNWAKFTATASIGVVHKGHVKESMNLLQPYLPQGGISSSPYSEGGALYALGLIHASKGGAGNQDIITYLHQALKYVFALWSSVCVRVCVFFFSSDVFMLGCRKER